MKLRDIINEIKVHNPRTQIDLYNKAIEVVKTFEGYPDQLQSFKNEFPNGEGLNNDTWNDWNNGYFEDNAVGGWNDANWQFILTNDESVYDGMI